MRRISSDRSAISAASFTTRQRSAIEPAGPPGARSKNANMRSAAGAGSKQPLSSAPAAKTQLAAAPVTEWAGATAPFGFFDPLGLSKDVDAGRLAFYREAEIKHGRVAMLASVGFLFQEHYTFTGIDSPSYVSFEQPGLAGGLWLGLAVMLGNVEGKSVESFMPLDGGIVAEQNESRLFRIKEDHAWISAENHRSHAIDATASARRLCP